MPVAIFASEETKATISCGGNQPELLTAMVHRPQLLEPFAFMGFLFFFSVPAIVAGWIGNPPATSRESQKLSELSA